MAVSYAEQLDWVPKSRTLAESLARAERYAREQGHPTVALEHLLLAFTEDADAASVLMACKVDLHRLRADVSAHLARMGDGRAQGAPPAADPDLSRILEYAAAAAQQSRRGQIDGAIVLAALVGDGKSAAAEICKAHGLTFELAVETLKSRLAPKKKAAAAPQPAPAVASAPPAAPPPQTQPAARAPQPPPAPQARAAQPAAPPPSAKAAPPPAPPPVPSPPPLAPRARAAPQPSAAPAPTAAPPPPPAASAPDRRPATKDDLSPPTFEPPPSPARGPLSSMESILAEVREQLRVPDTAEPPRPPAPAPESRGAPPPPPAYAPPPQPAADQRPQQPAPPPPPAEHTLEPQWEPAVRTRAESAYPPPQPAPAPPTQDHWAPLSPSPVAPPAAELPPIAAPPPSRAPAPPWSPAELQPPPPHGHEAPRAAPHEAQSEVPAPWPEPIDPRYAPQPSEVPPFPLDGNIAGSPFPSPDELMPPSRGQPPGADARPARRVEIGQMIENIPRTMRALISEVVEVRIARGAAPSVAHGMVGSGTPMRHDIHVTKAMTVRLRAPDGGFRIETTSPETQWIENTLGLLHDDFASWRWTVTPERRGKGRLQLIVSARSVGPDGMVAETALPDQIYDVTVSINYARTAQRLGFWLLAAVAGGMVHALGQKIAQFGLTKGLARFLGLG